MPTFNIATDQGVLQVEGEPITIGKWKCFWFTTLEKTDVGTWHFHTMSELSSGMKVCKSIWTIDEAIKEAYCLLEEQDYWIIKKKILSELSRNGIKYPVNL